MLTSKDRSYLKKIASNEQCVYQIGKDALGEAVVNGISQAINARELVKINVLQNCDSDIRELAQSLSEMIDCEIVTTLGRKIILYKFNPKNKNHVLQNNLK